jgi:hypothetical protein
MQAKHGWEVSTVAVIPPPGATSTHSGAMALAIQT